MVHRWIIFARRTNRLEKKYTPLFLQEIIRFRKKFIDDLRTHGKDYAVQRLQLAHINANLSKILQALYKEAGLLGAKMTAGELKEQVTQKAASFGTNQSWIDSVIQYLRLHLLKFVSKINETMRNDILKVLQKATDNGWSIDKTVDELERKDLARARARTIARTEIIRGANVGHSVASKYIPFEQDKKWLAAKDHRTRHSHRFINNHVVDEDATFKVPIYKGNVITGYDNMLYPGDATASAANVINCRCRVIYEAKRDSQGNLIPRRTDTATIIPLQSTTTQIPATQIAAILKSHVHVGVE